MTISKPARDTIVVVGSANMDLMLAVPHLPRPGETLAGRDFVMVPGGKGANQAVAAARQGAAVWFVGCVGDDAFAGQIGKALVASGVAIDLLNAIPGAATGVAIVLTDQAGENCIALDAGANRLLSRSHIDAAAEAIATAGLLVCQLESPIETVAHAVDVARRHGVATLLNPAPAQALSPELLRGLKFMVPNESEASILTGVEVTDVASATVAAKALVALGVETVLLTMGASGILVARAELVRHFPAKRVVPVDTTGAGDTFVGAFSAAWVRGQSLDAAVEAGQGAAAISVQGRGAQDSMPWIAGPAGLERPPTG